MHRPNCKTVFRALAIALLIGAPALARQDAPDKEPPPADTPEVVSSEGPVEIEDSPSDWRIEQRIGSILQTTDRFERLEIEVRDGVVFLRGVADTSDDRALAADLSRRTEGVAAVVNNLTIRESPVWTLTPAKNEVKRLVEDVIRALPLLVVGLGVLVLFMVVAGWVSRLFSRLLTAGSESELLRNVVRKGVFLVVLVLGVYLALRITGLTRVAITVISGTGLLGLILGFAFRDIAENFLASLLLSIQRPFRLGDVIEVDGHTGVVRKVTSRGTLLIDFDGNHIQIANSTVYKNTIKNFSANPKVRITFSVGIGYDDEIPRAQEVARRVLADHPAVLDDPEPLVLVHELGSSTVNLRIYFWIDGHEHSMLKVQSSVIRLTSSALAAEGISMPDEAREVIFPNGVPVVMQDQGAGGGGSVGAGVMGGAGEVSRARRDTAVTVDAEGDFSSEREDLNRQAEQSRDPESGANVLAEGESRS